jgi:hypothetical protein
MDKNFNYLIARRTLSLLDQRKARLYPMRTSFFVWPREDRVVVVFDPSVINIGKVDQGFAHDLSTSLQGRVVVRTNSRGLFLQVGYEIPPMLDDLIARPLDLSKQESPYHMPIGSSARSDIWISLLEGDSFFVVGLRNMGKSAEVHGFIQALLHGGKTLVYAWDGKDNAEYLRYVGREHFTLMPMNGLQNGLQAIQSITQQRMRTLAMSGHPNIISYNKTAKPEDYMMPIALVIDEVAEVEDQALLLKHVKVNRAAGVYPIFATNDPTKSSVVAKSNLATRISFHVPSTSDSITGFGRPGANKLPRKQGRGLVMHNSRVTEFQSFLIDYPQPSEYAKQWLLDQLSAQDEAPMIEPIEASEVDVERVKELHAAGKSATAITNEITGKTGGRPWMRTMELVKAVITTATTTSKSTDLTAFEPKTA